MMNDRHALYLSSSILLVLMIACGIFLAVRNSEKSSAPEPALVPSFSRAEFSSRDFLGKVSIVNIFASWCTPCEAEHPFLMNLKTNHGVVIYGIDFKDSTSGRVDYLQRLGNPYVAVTADGDGTLSETWGATGVPETYVIDSKGRIVHHHAGPLTPDDIESTILPLIRQLNN